jgi:hypothetical protein
MTNVNGVKAVEEKIVTLVLIVKEQDISTENTQLPIRIIR